MSLYENVKQAAKDKGYSVNRLEKELGFPRSYIAKFKTITPGVEKVRAIADFLDISVDYLMNGAEEDYYTPETAAIAQEIFENKELRLLFDSAKDADPSDLQTVHEMLLALKRKERHDG